MLSRVFRGGVYSLAVPKRSKNRRATTPCGSPALVVRKIEARSATWSFADRRAEVFVDGVLHTTQKLKPADKATTAMSSVFGMFDIDGLATAIKIPMVWWALVNHVEPSRIAPVIRQAWLKVPRKKTGGGKAQVSFGCPLVV